MRRLADGSLGHPEGRGDVRDDSAEEHARVAEEARRRAQEQAKAEQERARAESERAKSEALTGPMTQEVLGQRGLIYGGLILVGVYMVQPFLTAPSLDASAKVSIVAFAVAIPLLAALVMVNRQEAFRGRRTTSVTVTIAHVVAQLAAFVGIVAGFWHITWIAGVTFLAAGLVAVLIHSAGYWRVEQPHEPTS
jgi:cation transport ATPase